MRTISLLIFVALLASNAWNCTQPAKPAPSEKQAVRAITGNDAFNYPEISPAAAAAAEARWDSVRLAMFRDTTGFAIVYNLDGFQVPRSDVLDLVNIMAADTTITAELSVRLGPNGKFIPSLIFQIEDARGVTHYYDFSQPCPPCAQ